MPSLADTQTAIAHAMWTGDSRLAPDVLVGGCEALARLRIHLRHYEASLQAALREKFPATNWLLGSELMAAAAAAYVREKPPQAPCIAEYGSGFPAFVARFEAARALPYLESFATLEWALGRASIAVDETPLVWHDVVGAGPELLLDARLALQPGVSYLRASHDVDRLMRLYLSDEEPEMFAVTAGDVCIEVQGSRGSLRMVRLDPGTFVFRSALRAGESVSDAASGAIETNENFDAGQALRRLVDDGLLVSTDLTEKACSDS
jgi:hypothetical protein